MIRSDNRDSSESHFTSGDTCRNLEGNNELDSEAGISVTTITDAQQSSDHQNMECLVLSNPKISCSLDSECNHYNNSTLKASVPIVPSTVTGEIPQLFVCQNVYVSNPSLDTSEYPLSLENNVKHNSDDGKLCVEAMISTRSVFTTHEETQLKELIPQQVTSPNATLIRSFPGCERYKYKFIQ